MFLDMYQWKPTITFMIVLKFTGRSVKFSATSENIQTELFTKLAMYFQYSLIHMLLLTNMQLNEFAGKFYIFHLEKSIFPTARNRFSFTWSTAQVLRGSHLDHKGVHVLWNTQNQALILSCLVPVWVSFQKLTEPLQFNWCWHLLKQCLEALGVIVYLFLFVSGSFSWLPHSLWCCVGPCTFHSCT